MSNAFIVPCAHCGASYPLSAEYLAQFGGQVTTCRQCNQPFQIPMQAPPLAAVAAPTSASVLSYMGGGLVGSAAGVWREGAKLIVPKGAILPPRCVKCNAPVDRRPFFKKFYWHEPWVYVFLLAAVLIYAIVAACMQKSGSVGVHLCGKHRSRRLLTILALWLLLPGSIIGLIAAGLNQNTPMVLVSLCLLLLSIVLLVTVGRLLSPTRIDDHYLWLKGAGSEFLNTLPDAAAAR